VSPSVKTIRGRGDMSCMAIRGLRAYNLWTFGWSHGLQKNRVEKSEILVGGP